MCAQCVVVTIAQKFNAFYVEREREREVWREFLPSVGFKTYKSLEKRKKALMSFYEMNARW
jgi:hypothetical protein